MHVVVESLGFTAWVRNYPEQVCFTIVDAVSAAPNTGVLLQGTGGIRKRRVYLHGAYRGSLRVFTYYLNEQHPVYLVAGLNKNEAENLSKSERNALAKLVEQWKADMTMRARKPNPDGGSTIGPSLLFQRLVAGMQDARAHSMEQQALVTHVPLKNLRTRRGLTQTQAAAMLRVPVGTYRNWEQGRTRVPRLVLEAMQ
jgi:hypothetical protein